MAPPPPTPGCGLGGGLWTTPIGFAPDQRTPSALQDAQDNVTSSMSPACSGPQCPHPYVGEQTSLDPSRRPCRSRPPRHTPGALEMLRSLNLPPSYRLWRVAAPTLKTPVPFPSRPSWPRMAERESPGPEGTCFASERRSQDAQSRPVPNF